MRRLLPLLVVAFVMGQAAPALAAPPETTTTIRDVTVTFIGDIPPCLGGGPLYQLTYTYHEVWHGTFFGDGQTHINSTQTGDFVAVPFGHTGPGASGHFTVRHGSNQNNQSLNGTFTIKLTGEYDDGTRINFHRVGHLNVIPNGADFFFNRCHD